MRKYCPYFFGILFQIRISFSFYKLRNPEKGKWRGTFPSALQPSVLIIDRAKRRRRKRGKQMVKGRLSGGKMRPQGKKEYFLGFLFSLPFIWFLSLPLTHNDHDQQHRLLLRAAISEEENKEIHSLNGWREISWQGYQLLALVRLGFSLNCLQ